MQGGGSGGSVKGLRGPRGERRRQRCSQPGSPHPSGSCTARCTGAPHPSTSSPPGCRWRWRCSSTGSPRAPRRQSAAGGGEAGRQAALELRRRRHGPAPTRCTRPPQPATPVQAGPLPTWKRQPAAQDWAPEARVVLQARGAAPRAARAALCMSRARWGSCGRGESGRAWREQWEGEAAVQQARRAGGGAGLGGRRTGQAPPLGLGTVCEGAAGAVPAGSGAAGVGVVGRSGLRLVGAAGWVLGREVVVVGRVGQRMELSHDGGEMPAGATKGVWWALSSRAGGQTGGQTGGRGRSGWAAAGSRPGAGEALCAVAVWELSSVMAVGAVPAGRGAEEQNGGPSAGVERREGGGAAGAGTRLQQQLTRAGAGRHGLRDHLVQLTACRQVSTEERRRCHSNRRGAATAARRQRCRCSPGRTAHRGPVLPGSRPPRAAGRGGWAWLASLGGLGAEGASLLS